VTKIETVGEEYVFGHPTEMARSWFPPEEIGASNMRLHMFQWEFEKQYGDLYSKTMNGLFL